DVVSERTEAGAEHDRRRRTNIAELFAGTIGGMARIARTERRHAASLPASRAISARARAISRSRSSHGMNALQKPLSAISHNSPKVKPRVDAACMYSAVNVVPLIKRLSVFSTTFMPRSK